MKFIEHLLGLTPKKRKMPSPRPALIDGTLVIFLPQHYRKIVRTVADGNSLWNPTLGIVKRRRTATKRKLPIL